jgi:hypothetical protein
MGPDWERSKPTGLDVGVLHYGFLWFFLGEMGSLMLLLPLSHLIPRWVEGDQIRFDGLVQAVELSSFDSFAWCGWIRGGIFGYGDRSSFALRACSWGGGGGC